HVDEVFCFDALMRHLLEDEAAGGFLGVAHRSADRGAAAEPHDADGTIERVAATDFTEIRRVLLGTAPGDTGRVKGEVAHGHADAEDAWRYLWRLGLKVH